MYGTTGPNYDFGALPATGNQTNFFYTASTDTVTLENINIEGAATLNGATITSWPSGGGGGGNATTVNVIAAETASNFPLIFSGSVSTAAGTQTQSMGLDSGGNLTYNPSTNQLNVVNIVASGDISAVNFNSTSDASLKTNVNTITRALDKVTQLRGVNFDWIETGKSATGVIAQEIEAVLPEVVSEDDNGIKHVAYGNLVGVLIEAIKELKAEIEELKK